MGDFCNEKNHNFVLQEIKMKEQKTAHIGLRINDRQVEALDKIIAAGLANTRSGAIQYLINMYQVFK